MSAVIRISFVLICLTLLTTHSYSQRRYKHLKRAKTKELFQENIKTIEKVTEQSSNSSGQTGPLISSVFLEDKPEPDAEPIWAETESIDKRKSITVNRGPFSEVRFPLHVLRPGKLKAEEFERARPTDRSSAFHQLNEKSADQKTWALVFILVGAMLFILCGILFLIFIFLGPVTSAIICGVLAAVGLIVIIIGFIGSRD